MTHTTGIPGGLETDLKCGYASISFLDGGFVKEIHSAPRMGGKLSIELIPQLVIEGRAQSDGWDSDIIMRIPLEDILAIDVSEDMVFVDEDNHEYINPGLVASWYRGPNGEFLRFTPWE